MKAIIALIFCLLTTCLVKAGPIENLAYQTVSIPQIENAINSNPADQYILVIIGADWCGYCHQLAKWLDNSVSLSNVRVIKINGDTSPEVVAAFQNTGYPSWSIIKGNAALTNTQGAGGGQYGGGESGVCQMLKAYGVPTTK